MAIGSFARRHANSPEGATFTTLSAMGQAGSFNARTALGVFRSSASPTCATLPKRR